MVAGTHKKLTAHAREDAARSDPAHKKRITELVAELDGLLPRQINAVKGRTPAALLDDAVAHTVFFYQRRSKTQIARRSRTPCCGWSMVHLPPYRIYRRPCALPQLGLLINLPPAILPTWQFYKCVSFFLPPCLCCSCNEPIFAQGFARRGDKPNTDVCLNKIHENHEELKQHATKVLPC